MVSDIAPPDGTEFLVDGVTDIHIHEAVFRCTFFTKQKTGGEVRIVETVRIAIPMTELPDVIQALVIALTKAAKDAVRPMLS